jgi:hypothetical protein
MVIFGALVFGVLSATFDRDRRNVAFEKNNAARNEDFSSETLSYQAIFLDNDKTYFGKVSGDPEATYVLVDDVHYVLQNATSSVSTDAKKNADKKSRDESAVSAEDVMKPGYSLVKLGQEFHGPKSMLINRDHIVMIQDLRDDSLIVQTILRKNEKNDQE